MTAIAPGCTGLPSIPPIAARGHGRALVAQAEAWAIARRLPKLMLLIREDNDEVAVIL